MSGDRVSKPSSGEVVWEEWAERNTDPFDVRMKDEALDDVLVLDISYGNFAGLFCSSTLGEFGARVIRIEPPGGDIARKMSPFGMKVSDTGLAYLAEARNKEHITLNIESEKGRELFKKIVKKADVLIETYPAGYMSELGLGYPELKDLNPRLIYVGINAYGQYGPEARKGKKVSELIAEALSGLVYITGEPEGDGPQDHTVPTKHGNWMAWYAGGGFAAFAVLVALHFRHLTGKGQFIDVSEAESLMRFLDYNCLWYHTMGRIRERVGNYDPAVFPYTYVKSKDGYTFLAGFSDINWTALTTIMKNPELRERYPTIFERLQLKNEMEIHRELEKWAMNYTSDEILAMVQEYDRTVGKGVVATGRVNTPLDTIGEDNWWKRGVFKKIKDPIYGEILIQLPPWKMTETPPRLKTLCKPVGEDNEYVYGEFFGFGKKALEELRNDGVI